MSEFLDELKIILDKDTLYVCSVCFWRKDAVYGK